MQVTCASSHVSSPSQAPVGSGPTSRILSLSGLKAPFLTPKPPLNNQFRTHLKDLVPLRAAEGAFLDLLIDNLLAALELRERRRILLGEGLDKPGMHHDGGDVNTEVLQEEGKVLGSFQEREAGSGCPTQPITVHTCPIPDPHLPWAMAVHTCLTSNILSNRSLRSADRRETALLLLGTSRQLVLIWTSGREGRKRPQRSDAIRTQGGRKGQGGGLGVLFRVGT